MIRRLIVRALEGLGALAAVAALAAVVLVWRLAAGPVSLDFLKPQIAEALSASDGDYRVEVDNTELNWAGWRGSLDLRVRGARVVAADGRLIGLVPELAVNLSLPALVRGMIAPTSLEIVAPRLRLIRTEDGAIAWKPEESGAAPTESPDSSADFLARLLTELTSPESTDRPLGFLTSVRIRDADIVLDDRRLGMVWHVPDADATASRDRNGILTMASFHTTIGEQTARFEFEGVVAPDGSSALTVEFENVDLDNLARSVADLRAFAGLRVPLKGRGSVNLAGGRIDSASLELSGGPGGIIHERLANPVPIRSLQARARFTGEGARLDIETAEADLGGPVLTAAGTIDDLGGAGLLNARFGVRSLPTPDLYRYWPPSVAKNARGWIVDNIADGTVDLAEARIQGRLGGDVPVVESLNGTMRTTGLTVNYLKPMPPARRVAATASFDLDRFDIVLLSGALRELTLASGTVKLTDLRTNNETALIDLTLRGRLREAIEVIDSKPLGYASKLNLKPADIAGDSAIRLTARVPLIHDLDLDEIEIAASATLSKVSVKKVVMGFDAEDAALVLRVDKRGLDLSGTGHIGGLNATMKWIEDFADNAKVTTRIEAKARIGAEDHQRLGLNFAPYLTGPVDVDLTAMVREPGKTEISVNLGLDDAVLSLPMIEWTKPAGTAAQSGLELTLNRDKLGDIRSFAFVAPDLRAQGRASFLPEGGLARVELTNLVHGLTNVAANIVLRADGGFDMDIAGAGLDAKPLLEAAKRPGGEKMALKVNAKIDRVYLDAGRSLDGLTGALVHDGKHWRTINVDARTGASGQLTLRFGQAGPGQTMSLTATDAGALLHVFDITDNIEGGRIQINGGIDDRKPNRPLVGQLQIDNFRMKHAPLLARLLTVASFTGIGELLTGEGIQFTRLDGNYRVVDPVVELEDIRLYGSSLGVTAKGTLNLDNDIAAIEGTIVPAYAINSLLGNIPVLGPLLVGPRGSGVFAATYKVDGPLTDPSISVNPLATLAPGFLRRLFNIFDGRGTTGAPGAGPDDTRGDTGG